MPRKTIASLEAEIARLKDEVAARDERIDFLSKDRQRLHEEQARRSRDVYLSYVPSGFVEVDAVHVVTRTIDSLRDPQQQQAVVAWVTERFRPPTDKED